jgi:hypothetical protein
MIWLSLILSFMATLLCPLSVRISRSHRSPPARRLQCSADATGRLATLPVRIQPLALCYRRHHGNGPDDFRRGISTVSTVLDVGYFDVGAFC